MPCPHNEITIVQRSQRQSAVAAAAYQSGEKLFCEYDQQVKHYPEKRGIVHNEILLPANAPQSYADRNTLWNAAEAVEKQWNSQLARRWVLTIPREIPPDQYAVLVREFCQKQFVSKGMIADFAIHDPHPPGHNPHAYVQSLYEKKLTTYPRTDSCYITDDDEEMLEELTEELEVFLDITPEDMDEAVPRTRRTVNREKVTDHHAILPTRSMLQADLDALPKGEQNVLKLIIARTLMAVSKPFRYLETLLTTECAGEEFTAKGKEILEEGWKAVERKVLADILNRKQELTALPNAAENECGILNAELKEGQTSPPKHFTEDTLLHAMETASADSMPEGVERQGIGTPATRAATIEKLVQKGFLERKGTKKTKVLLPTDKGKALITVMPEEIQSPEMTADWETKLLQIERSEMEPETFMTEIKEMISSLVTTTEAAKGANALMKNKIIGVCPNCGKPVVEREKGWFCENRECRFVLWKDNAFFKRLGKRLDAHVADKLLRDGRVRLKDCKSAKGKTYNATVLLSCEADGRSRFSLEFEGGC